MKRTKKSKEMPVAPKAVAVAEARPAPIVRNDWYYTRLRVGDIIVLHDSEYAIDFVNECRARAIPLTRKQVSYKTVAGKTVEFETDYSGQNISPNSMIPILQRLGPNWRENINKPKPKTKDK